MGHPALRNAVPKDLNRVREIRQREEATLRTVHRQMGISIREARALDNPGHDLRLGDLYRLAKIFQVPACELLVDDDELGVGVGQIRGQLLRVLKTIRSIKEQTRETHTRRHIESLEGLLLQAFPEMQETSPWHTVGVRRTTDDVGRVAVHPVETDHALRDLIANISD